jgi:hypothetical protein
VAVDSAMPRFSCSSLARLSMKSETRIALDIFLQGGEILLPGGKNANSFVITHEVVVEVVGLLL